MTQPSKEQIQAALARIRWMMDAPCDGSMMSDLMTIEHVLQSALEQRGK